MGKFLIVLGGIIAGLSGGCSLLFFADMGVNDPFSGAILVIGGIPFVIGIGLLLVGIAVNKHKAKRAAQDRQTP